MEFAKHGVINAGLIFFSVVLLSTLILGRWFCGWGCHIVMLQDLCGWLMKKMGVAEAVPLALLILRAAAAGTVHVCLAGGGTGGGAAAAGVAGDEVGCVRHARTHRAVGRSDATDDDPVLEDLSGVMVAIPFLFVCGFATVYFLVTAKGFCTYGCPYGDLCAARQIRAGLISSPMPAKAAVTARPITCACTKKCEYGMVSIPAA